jgi:hypothetical protein
MNDAEQIIKRADTLKGLKGNVTNSQQEAANYCLPLRANVTTTKSPGQSVSTENFDSTARNSAQIFGASLHSYMTNPASKWFSLRTKDKILMAMKPVKVWLKTVEDIIYNVLNASNFAQEVHEGYLDLGVMGTFVLYEEEDDRDYVRFYCRPTQEVQISEGADGRVDTVYRTFKLSARQATQKWGANAGQAIAKAIEMKEYDKEFTFIHCVEPRHVREVGKEDAINMPFRSVYIEISQKHICEEGGYKEFPFFVPRFSKLSGEVWGYSPAFVCMPDIKMLNAMSKVVIRAAQKIVDPPVEIPHDGYLLPLNLNAAGINFKMQGTADSEIKPIQTGGNIPVGLEMIQDLRRTVQRAFFVDVFLMLNQNDTEKTATEVNELSSEKMLIVGPVLGRLMSELLNPLINRTFSILAQRGVLPPLPDELKGREYVIEYISPLAKAQKFQEINSLNQLMALITNMSQVFPTVLHKINSDKVIDTASDIYGVNPEVVLDDKEVGAVREAEAQKLQMQQELAAAQQVATTAKDGSQAVKNLQPAPAGKGKAA